MGTRILKSKTAGIVVLLAVMLGIITTLRRLPERPPITVRFSGYTNDPVDPTGRLLFAVFQITNAGRTILTCNHGPFEIKSAAGWTLSHEYTRSNSFASLERGKGTEITVWVPSSNSLWRANFAFEEMFVPTAQLERVARTVRLEVSTLQPTPRHWKVRIDELATEFY